MCGCWGARERTDPSRSHHEVGAEVVLSLLVPGSHGLEALDELPQDAGLLHPRASQSFCVCSHGNVAKSKLQNSRGKINK